MASGTTKLLHSYIEYQKYLINEMVYNPTLKNGKTLKGESYKRFYTSRMNDIMKLEVEIKHLQEKYQQEQFNDTKAFYLKNVIRAKNKMSYEIENNLDTKKIKKPSTKKLVITKKQKNDK